MLYLKVAKGIALKLEVKKLLKNLLFEFKAIKAVQVVLQLRKPLHASYTSQSQTRTLRQRTKESRNFSANQRNEEVNWISF
jgi:hypothetical protein